MSDPTWGAQEVKTFADFEQRPPDTNGVDQSKIGHTEHLTSLLEKLRPRFALAFGQQAREEIDWEIGMMFYPNPQNQSMQAVLVIFAMTAGAVIGTTVSTSTMVPPLLGMEDHIDEWVRQTLESLRMALSEQLRVMQEQPRDHGLQPPVNGGLIFPGK